MISIIAFAASAAILVAYASGNVRRLHQANALGCFPIIISEIVVGAYPALVLTAAFGVIGWVALWRDRRLRRRYNAKDQAEFLRELFGGK